MWSKLPWLIMILYLLVNNILVLMLLQITLKILFLNLEQDLLAEDRENVVFWVNWTYEGDKIWDKFLCIVEKKFS